MICTYWLVVGKCFYLCTLKWMRENGNGGRNAKINKLPFPFIMHPRVYVTQKHRFYVFSVL